MAKARANVSAKRQTRNGTTRQRHDPPALLPDFSEAQRRAWDELIALFFSSSETATKDNMRKGGGHPEKLIYQYFDPTTYDDALIVQPITWNAFPKELLVRFGRQRALAESDRLWPIGGYYANRFFLRYYDSDRAAAFDPTARNPNNYPADFMTNAVYRPQVEYCEWHVTRNHQTGKIDKVAFTSEPPEYWTAMWGGVFPGTDIVFPDGRGQVLQLYRELVNPSVELEDLICPYSVPDFNMVRGGYNPYNKWNCTHGIAHLAAPPNSLGAEIQLGSDATVRYVDASGQPVTEPQTLICCAAYGGVNRNSDPTIGSAVNSLARLGAMLTLTNPVGLYMDHIDLTGWETGDGSSPEEWVHIVRGSPGMIERLVVKPPSGSSKSVSDLRIAGEPVAYGGQIAECITVKLNGGARDLGKVQDNYLMPCVGHCCISPLGGSELALLKLKDPLPPGTVTAMTPVGGYPKPPPDAPTAKIATLGMRHRNPMHFETSTGSE